MSYGPFRSPEQMARWLEGCARSRDPLFFTVGVAGRPVGMTSFLNIVPKWRRLELGHIWLAPEVQRSHVLTEMAYLMLRHAFDELGYRRVEWKCDTLNERSRLAAQRLGFAFEGIFRQHMIIKGRNRDTAWFAMLDSDWKRIGPALRTWLDSPGSTPLRRYLRLAGRRGRPGR
jgi:RimJ/RimL family protein N-acetyltransferase